MQRLSFKNPKRGQVKRAAFYLRWSRRAKLKRLEYERDQVEDTAKRLRRQIAQMYAIAKAYKVPLDPMAPLPPIPDLPSQAWIEHLQDMGDLKPPVNDKPPVKPQAEPDPRDAFAISWNKPRDAT